MPPGGEGRRIKIPLSLSFFAAIRYNHLFQRTWYAYCNMEMGVGRGYFSRDQKSVIRGDRLNSSFVRSAVLLCLLFSLSVSAFPMGSIENPDRIAPGRERDRQAVAGSVIDGILGMRNQKTRLVPSHWGQPGFERLGFLYDNSVAAMVLYSAGKKQEAEDILDYFVAKLRVPKAWIEANEDCNDLFGIVKLIRVDRDRTLKTLINTVDIERENLMGKGIAEYATSPGPVSFFVLSLLKVNPQKYLNDAVALGNVLLYFQNHDGGVLDGDRDVGRVYTDPHVVALAAFQMLYDITLDLKWKNAADRARKWFFGKVYESSSGRIFQGWHQGIPNRVFAEDCYALTMAGPLGDALSTAEIRKITELWLGKCLTSVTLRLPDGNVRTLLLADFADPADNLIIRLRGGFHPMGSPEWTGGAILALQKNAVRMWKAGDKETARFYKSVAEVLTENVFQSYYRVPGLNGKITFYATGQMIDVGPFRIGGDQEQKGWYTPVYHVVTPSGPGSVRGGSVVGVWPMLPFYGVNPLVLNDDYLSVYRVIDMPDEIWIKTAQYLKMAVTNRSYTELLLKENPWPEAHMMEPNQFNARMWDSLKTADKYRDKNEREKAREYYAGAISWSQEVLKDQNVVDLARKENRLKKEEMGGIIWYPWGKTFANNEGELLNQVLRYPLLNEVAASMYGIIAANYELGDTNEVRRYMEILLDDYPLHQIAAIEEDRLEVKGLISGFWNALQSWEDSPQYQTREGDLGKIYWEILGKRKLKTAKPEVMFFEDTRRYQMLHNRPAVNTNGN